MKLLAVGAGLVGAIAISAFAASLVVDAGVLQTWRVNPDFGPPVAEAGADQTVGVGDTVTLDGSSSTDPQGDPLTYVWTLTPPAGSTTALDDTTSSAPSFIADVEGPYVAELVVSDGTDSSTPDSVTIVAEVVRFLEIGEIQFDTFSSTTLNVTLSEPAGAGGVDVALEADPTSLITLPTSVTIAEGSSSAGVTITSGSAAGPTTVTATATGWQSGSGVVTIDPRTMSLELDPLVGLGRTNPGSVVLDEPAPSGGVTVSLGSSDPTIVSVSPSSVAMDASDSTADFTVTGESEGSVIITASASGYEDATVVTGGTDTTVSVGTIPTMSPGQSVSLPISLSEPAPPGGKTVLLESSDPSIATVDASVTIPEGSFTPPTNPQVTGLSIGTATITARASGFAPDSRAATVQFTMTVSLNPIQTYEGWPRSVTIGLSGPAPTGGLLVELVSGDTAVFTVPDDLLVPQGQTSAQFVLSGVQTGSSTLTLSGEGVSDVVVPVTVSPQPDVSTSNVSVGADLQTTSSVRLTQTPPQPTDITVTIASESAALLSTSRTGVGSKSITFTGVTNTSGRTFYVQGLDEGATTTFTAQAAGYNDSTSNVSVMPSGFHLWSPNDFTTTTSSNNTTIYVRSYRLSETDALSTIQELRAGFGPVAVEVTSSDPAVGTITASPLSFTGGGGDLRTTQFDPLTAGTTTIAFTQPTGFTTPANGRTSITATATVTD